MYLISKNLFQLLHLILNDKIFHFYATFCWLNQGNLNNFAFKRYLIPAGSNDSLCPKKDIKFLWQKAILVFIYNIILQKKARRYCCSLPKTSFIQKRFG